MSKKILLMVAVFMMAVINVHAQQIRTIDKDGQPIPYASIMTPDAKYIGITDLEGVVADVKGADTIVISHVAYNTKKVWVGGKSGSVTLDEKDFGLPEIVVKKKSMVYAQTYYRIYMYQDSLGIIYYRSGLTDNVYNRSTKKLSTSTQHTSKALWGIIKTIINVAVGGKMDKLSEIYVKKVETKIQEKYKDSKCTITPMESGKKRISDFKGTIGYVTDNQQTGTRRISLEATKAYNHLLEAKGKTKQLAKREKREKEELNKTESDYYVFRIDERGNYDPEDLVMKQWLSSWDEKDKHNGRMNHYIMAMEVYTTDRAYVDKDELKQRQKDNKMKMTYQNIRQFESQHNIPALAPAVQKKLNELWKVDKD